MEKFIKNLENAKRLMQTIDHMTYVTFPLLKDKKLLLKILLDTKEMMASCINAILQYEYLYKRIRLYSDPKSNFRTFREKSAQRFNITNEEIDLIKELFYLAQEHKKSPFEFIKNNKVVILSQDLKPQTITLEKTKEFLQVGKNILRKAKEGILT